MAKKTKVEVLPAVPSLRAALVAAVCPEVASGLLERIKMSAVKAAELARVVAASSAQCCMFCGNPAKTGYAAIVKAGVLPGLYTLLCGCLDDLRQSAAPVSPAAVPVIAAPVAAAEVVPQKQSAPPAPVDRYVEVLKGWRDPEFDIYGKCVSGDVRREQVLYRSRCDSCDGEFAVHAGTVAGVLQRTGEYHQQVVCGVCARKAAGAVVPTRSKSATPKRRRPVAPRRAAKTEAPNHPAPATLPTLAEVMSCAG
jgi:hypothetical protein